MVDYGINYTLSQVGATLGRDQEVAPTEEYLHDSQYGELQKCKLIFKLHYNWIILILSLIC